jgi:hypothetical protein
MSRQHPLVEEAVELDPRKRAKLDVFREEVKRASERSTINRVYKEFNSLQDFEVANRRCGHLCWLLNQVLKGSVVLREPQLWNVDDTRFKFRGHRLQDQQFNSMILSR